MLWAIPILYTYIYNFKYNSKFKAAKNQDSNAPQSKHKMYFV